MNIQYKEARLQDIIRELESVAVAFSAGTDSTYLLAVCCNVLGPEHVVAVTAHSPTLPEQELEEARKLADIIGVRLEIVTTYEMDNPEYVSNDINRCFHCQQERFTAIWDVARAYGFKSVVSGITGEDVGDYRPGIRAAQEHHIRMPLLDAHMDKGDIRTLSEQMGLPNHNKPSNPCLSSRIPYGKPIRVENLEQVSQAEQFLKWEMEFHQVRVRHHDSVARIEVDIEELPRIVDPEIRERIIQHLRGLGFTYITLDLSGFRSGSMNEGLHLL